MPKKRVSLYVRISQEDQARVRTMVKAAGCDNLSDWIRGVIKHEYRRYQDRQKKEGGAPCPTSGPPSE